MSKLPLALEEGCPCPDVDLVISIIMRTDAGGVNGKTNSDSGGVKRGRGSAADTGAVAAAPAMTDLFHMRQRLKVEGH
jgi:hypothetical protein